MLAWRSLEDLIGASDRRGEANAYIEAVAAFRRVTEELVISGRTFAITGDSAWLTAAQQAGADILPAHRRAQRAGAVIGAPDRFRGAEAAVDTARTRLLRIQLAGDDGAAARARALAETEVFEFAPPPA